MKTYAKLTLALLAGITITSCAALRTPDLTKISIGMDKQTTIAALKKKPDGVVGSKKYPNGVVEVLDYLTDLSQYGHPEHAWLYFYNNKLVQFGKPTGNWIIEADNIGFATN